MNNSPKLKNIAISFVLGHQCPSRLLKVGHVSPSRLLQYYLYIVFFLIIVLQQYITVAMLHIS